MKKLQYYLCICISLLLFMTSGSQIFAAETTGTLSNEGGGVQGDVIDDSTAPDAINDLAAAVDGTVKDRINLAWTAPNDTDTDGAGTPGPAYQYLIRYSTTGAITAGNWGSATPISNNLTPQAAGNGEIFFVDNFTPGTYNLAIRAQDRSGNLANISNSPGVTVIDTRPTIANNNPTTNDNSVDRNVTINGTNFDTTPANNTIQMVNGGGSVTLNCTVAIATQLTVTVPAGTAPGSYKFIVSNNNGTSANGGGYTVTEVADPLPVVSNITPSIGGNGDVVDVTIIGQHFFKLGVSHVTAVNINGTVLINVSVVSDTKITADVPPGIADGIYSVKVTTSAGTNNDSGIRYESSTPTGINPGNTTDVNTTEVVDLSAFAGQGTTEIAGEIQMTNNNAVQVNENIEVLSSEVTIPADTVITSNDAQYSGNINPPRIVDIDETLDNANEIDPATGIVFQMGNPDQRIDFSQDVVITFEIRANTRPYLWFYNTYVLPNVFELAGKNKAQDGITYEQGGALLGQVGDVYTIGLLVDHMSAYVAGVVPQVTGFNPAYADIGQNVIVTGSNFHTNATATVGGVNAAATYNSTTQLTVTIPNGLAQGNNTVVVTNPDALNGSKDIFLGPHITSRNPISGASNTTFTIAGDNLTGGKVTFDGTDVTENVVNDSTINVTVPSLAAGNYNVAVTNADGLQDTTTFSITAGGGGGGTSGGGGGGITEIPNIYEYNNALTRVASYNDYVLASIKTPPEGSTYEEEVSMFTKDKTSIVDLQADTINNMAGSYGYDKKFHLSIDEIYANNFRGSMPEGLLRSKTKIVKITFTRDEDKAKVANLDPKAKVSFRYIFSSDARLDSAAVHYYDDKSNKWIRVDGILNEKDRTVTAEIDHFNAYFTIFAVAKGDEFEAVPLKDIQGHWAYYYIVDLFNRGIVKGHADSQLFSPNSPVNRAELTKMAVLSFHFDPEEAKILPFPDVRLGMWYTKFIALAKAKMMVNGYPDGLFKPTRNVNRAEALKIMLEAAGIEICTTDCPKNIFADVTPGSWYEKYVLTAYKLGIIEGYGTNGSKVFRPASPISRGEVAKIIYKVLQLI